MGKENAPMAPFGKETPALPVGEAGLERFHSQAAGIALDITSFGADEAIWLGIVGALGYPRNKRAFRAVATRVDWDMAVECAMGHGAIELERLLTRAAGLGDGGDAGSIKQTHSVPGAPRRFRYKSSPPHWVLPWGRPANAPATRIKAISHLFLNGAGRVGLRMFADRQ
jgi:hypothetical protein